MLGKAGTPALARLPEALVLAEVYSDTSKLFQQTHEVLAVWQQVFSFESFRIFSNCILLYHIFSSRLNFELELRDSVVPSLDVL